MVGRREVLLLLSLSCGVIIAEGKRAWVVGYEKVNGNCVSVGGSAEKDEMPFPYASMSDCLNDIKADAFDEKAKLWKGVILTDGDCMKVWGRAKANPFTETDLSKCEKEKENMQKALAKGSRTKRETEDGRKIARLMLDATITALSIYNPLFALLMPLVASLWPEGPSAWDQVKYQVKDLLDQRMNEAHAAELASFISDLEREINTYNEYSDDSSIKLSKAIALDTSIGLKKGRVMDSDDPVPIMYYVTPYITASIFVKFEIARIAAPNDKQQFAKETLRLYKEYIPYLGNLAYTKLRQWRLEQIECSYRHIYGDYDDSWEYTWYDRVTKKTLKREVSYSLVDNPDQGSKAWCAGRPIPTSDKLEALIDTIRENIRALGSMFNLVATNPLVTGFSAADSNFTTDNDYCEFPFTHSGVQYTKCTTVGKSQPWCKKKDGTDANCMALAKLAIDLTSCKMATSSTEQYFGHKNVAGNGAACKMWTGQGSYSDFPMDNQDKALASNYCRRTGSDSNPWCYTVPTGTWSYCNIPACTSADWS